MKQSFICFALRDASFAGLLKRLLRFHNFDPSSDNAVEPPDGIDVTWMHPAILQADVFLLVLFKHILGYDWAGAGIGSLSWQELRKSDLSRA